jgi:hypothetical protein
MGRDDILVGAWLEPSRLCLGSHRLRPFSWGSDAAIRRLELAVDWGDALTPEVASTYIWLHAAPLDDILTAIQDPDELEAALTDWELEVDPVPHLHQLSAYLQRTTERIVAASITIRSRPRVSGAEDDPLDVVEPGYLACMIAAVAGGTGWAERDIVWEMPMDRVLQYYHAIARAAGAWTIPAAPAGAASVPAVSAAQVDEILAQAVPHRVDPDAVARAWLENI